MRRKNALKYDVAMLDVMRRHAYSWMTRVVLGLIVLVFMFWGIGSGVFEQVQPIAKVNGTPILPSEVDREANQMRQSVQSVYGADAARVLQGMNLRQEALNRIIESRLIDHEARALGVRITDDELQKRITSQPGFLSNGQFDFRTYQEMLRDQNYLPTEFEDAMRSQMMNEFMRRMIDGAVQPSPAEVRHAYDLRNQRVALSFVEIPYQRFTAKITPGAQQVADFYTTGSAQFREPERASIAFIHYQPLLLAAHVTPAEKDIESYYKRFLRSRFSYPDRVHARHILVRSPAGAAAAQQDAARAKGQSLLAEVTAGRDFKKIAEKNSDDLATRRQGGDLGLFARGQMIKPFEDAVFKMKPGEVALVQTEFGFHVVKLDDLQPAHEDTLEVARPAIIEALRAEAGSKLAREALNQDRIGAEQGRQLDEIAKSRGLDVVQTPKFARGESIAAAPTARPLAETPFELEPGRVRVVTDNDNFYLMKLLSKDPARIPPLAEIEPAVRDMLVRQLAAAEARAQAKKLLEQIKGAAEFASVAAVNQLEVTKVNEFPRSSRAVPGLGEFREVTDAAGIVPAVPGVIDRVMEHNGNSYLFLVTARSAPSDEEWKKDEKSFTDEYLSLARAQAWTRFVDDLRARAILEVDRDRLGRTSGA
ncbi:MAG: SurA N-terminal domain-containing protein [Candidatus Binataceae bacterium]